MSEDQAEYKAKKPIAKKKTKVKTVEDLLRWLFTDCDESEIKENADGSRYLGVKTIKNKLRYMFETYGVQTRESGFTHISFTSNRDVFVSGSLDVELVGELFSDKLAGAATINVKNYAGNEHYGATVKSLCLNNAMLKYPQFGANINDHMEDTIPQSEEPKKLKPGMIERKKMENAEKNNDKEAIEKLNQIYDFTDVTTK